MSSLSSLRLLGDQVIVKCLGTADKIGSIWVPLSAQEARKIHQSGADYLHRGEIVAVGPGDKTAALVCSACYANTQHIPRRKVADKDIFTLGKCRECGGELVQIIDRRGRILHGRAAMPVSVGDIVLYERRRDAALQPKRFPSLDLDGDDLVVLLAEQHILAILETADERKAAA